MAKERVRPSFADLESFDIAAEHADAKRVKCGDQGLGQRAVTQQALHALGHLRRCLVCKRNCQNGIRRDALLLDEPRYAAGDDARFT